MKKLEGINNNFEIIFNRTALAVFAAAGITFSNIEEVGAQQASTENMRTYKIDLSTPESGCNSLAKAICENAMERAAISNPNVNKENWLKACQQQVAACLKSKDPATGQYTYVPWTMINGKLQSDSKFPFTPIGNINSNK